MHFLHEIGVIVLLLSIYTGSTQRTLYVRPRDSSPESCPSQPCLTLDQYTQQTTTYFTTGSTFVFLAGNHTALSVLNITNVAGITLKSDLNSYILCSRDFTIFCENITQLVLNGLTFLHSSNSERHLRSSTLEILNSSNVLISQSTFRGHGDLTAPSARAVNCTQSTITITSCYFEGNTGDHGGAIYASSGSNVTLTGNVFTRNKAFFSGGAIFSEGFVNLFMTDNKFLANSAVYNGGALDCKHCAINMTGSNTFKNNHGATNGGAIHISQGNLTTSGTVLFSRNMAKNGGGISISYSGASLNGRVVMFRENLAVKLGGALHVVRSKPLLPVSLCAQHLYFTGNVAKDSGGAIYIEKGYLIMDKSNVHFINNSGARAGGAIHSKKSDVKIMGNSYYIGNHVKFPFSQGGAIKMVLSNFSLYGYALFTGNKAFRGGAIQLAQSSASLNGTTIEFEDNLADTGGAIQCEESQMEFHNDRVWFSNNIAKSRGGAVAILSNKNDLPITISGNFIHNTANDCGGAVFVQKAVNTTLTDITVTNNTGSGVCLFYSQTFIGGAASIVNNTGKFGGGFHFENSMILFSNNVTLAGNRAVYGGGVYSVYGRVILSGISLLALNIAHRDGGAIFALGTAITLNNTILFSFNTAQNGGAVYFKSSATVSLTPQTSLTMSHNHVAEYGGAVYNEDNTVPSQCNFRAGRPRYRKDTGLLPRCFIWLTEEKQITVHSNNNSAGKDGHFLYGGLLDRCRIPILNSDKSLTKLQFGKFINFHNKPLTSNTSKDITSQPYQLCFCTSDQRYNCTTSRAVEVYRGQKFVIPLLAIDQMDNLTSTLVTAKTSLRTWVFMKQRTQNIDQHCTDVEYTLYSTKDYEELILYPEGPCRDVGIARAVINVTFQPCPVGFSQTDGRCVCENRLQKYHADCRIDAGNFITRNDKVRFWIGTLYVNNSFKGLILYETCPAEYCKTGNISISLEDLDVQCDQMHAGVLCGSCAANYSLLLGSSRCGECPNNSYLALLLPFAAAGIALVVFLSLLRLTVATGMINSMILYANIVQVNRKDFFPINKSNLLTVFIAWLNLDLGFETCFYNGMTAHAQTWLQFAFPIYVWILISLIILTSRYSITVSKLIGHNPVAVLATLLLMSYTKIIKILIEVYSFARLDYPDNKTEIVWLKDGNVPYSDPLLLLLTVVTSLVHIFLFLPYTLLLLIGYKLYRFTDKKYFKWVNRIKPLLDSYYAPYKSHTRYWTGFLLLVRWILYMTFTFNSHTLTNTAIVVTFAAVLGLCWVSGRIYNKLCTNLLEAATYLNLIVLSAATLAGFNSSALAYSLVGMVFATMVGIILYHFIRLQIVAACMIRRQSRVTSLQTHNSIDTNSPVNRMSTYPKPVSTSTVSLREPFLDDY